MQRVAALLLVYLPLHLLFGYFSVLSHIYLWMSVLFSVPLSGQLSLIMTRGGTGCSVCHLRAKLTKRKHSLRL